jgi:hypothetical protein
VTAASKRPDLTPGASYGEDITLADLRIGDEFYAPQTPRRAQIGGTIEKLSRVTLGYKTLYMERIATLRARQSWWEATRFAARWST